MSLNFVSAGQFIDELPEAMPWIIEPLCTHGSSVMIYGRQKIGKSSVIMQLIHSLTTGEPWLGFRVHKTGNVLYLQLDMAQLELSRIIWRAENAGMNVRDKLFVPKPEPGEHRISFDILRDEDQAGLRELVVALDPVAVIVDTINDAYTSVEHGDINAFIRRVHRRFMEAVGNAALIFLNHKRKQSQQKFGKGGEAGDDDEDGYLGGSAWAGVVASNLELMRTRETKVPMLILRDLRLDAYPATRIELQKDENGFFKAIIGSQQMLHLWPDCLAAAEREKAIATCLTQADIFRDIAARTGTTFDAVKKQYQRAPGADYRFRAILADPTINPEMHETKGQK